MEAYQLTVDIIVLALANPANKSLSQIVVNFLDNQDIKALNQQLEKSQKHSSFAQLIKTYYFLNNYLNKVDRTFYYSFYEQHQFRNIQNTHNALLSSKYSNCFLQFPNQYRKCLLFIQNLFPESVQPTELANEIQRMITDTDIPMPRLKRQNQGIFCKTSFQNYLIYLKFRSQCLNDYQEVFDGLNTYFQTKQQIYVQKLFMKAFKDKKLGKKIRFLRFTPYQITQDNFEQNLVQNNSLHNFLVAIFVITDTWLNSISNYIQSIEDPFHKYIQLITRYSIYRNYVISIQENLSFVFEKYNGLYEQVFGGNKPTYRFWRPAMTKWIQKFKKYHPECTQIFYYCLTKLRSESAVNFLELKQQQQPEIYMTIKNKMMLREYQLEINDQIKQSNGVEDFFEKDKELYQTIIMEFVEYMVDLSINQETVHWCGHSEQVLSQPYKSFQNYILEQNKKYLKYIRDLVDNKQIEKTFKKEYFKSQIEFLQTLQIKPLTLKKIVQEYNLQLSENVLGNGQSQAIIYDCKVNNQTLRYFNLKANIKFEIPEQQMCFYSITPLVTSQQLLTKSISTNYDSGKQEEQESDCCQLEYFSRSSDVDRYGVHDKFKDFDEQKSQKYYEEQQQYRYQLNKQENQQQNKQFEQHLKQYNLRRTSQDIHSAKNNTMDTHNHTRNTKQTDLSKHKPKQPVKSNFDLIKRSQSLYIESKKNFSFLEAQHTYIEQTSNQIVKNQQTGIQSQAQYSHNQSKWQDNSSQQVLEFKENEPIQSYIQVQVEKLVNLVAAEESADTVQQSKELRLIT